MRKGQGSAGQRPATRQAYQNGRRRVKKGCVEGTDRGKQKDGGKRYFTGDAGVKRSPALGGHDARYAERRPPFQEHSKIILTVIDHIIL
jgi:hypothetical protein